MTAYPHWWSPERIKRHEEDMRSMAAMAPDPHREGSVMCRYCRRQIQRCICAGPNDAPLDTGPNAI